jgi:two-component system, cell cycle sensor histidine kinase and response regulator CckA
MRRTATAPADAIGRTPRADAIEVLLVTPDADLRSAGARALVCEGYHVRVASHSGHAVLASRAGRVDILIAELSAPDISGPALADLLKKHHPGLRAVFMANPGTPEGLEHVIVRPFTRDDLLKKIAATSSLAS